MLIATQRRTAGLGAVPGPFTYSMATGQPYAIPQYRMIDWSRIQALTPVAPPAPVSAPAQTATPLVPVPNAAPLPSAGALPQSVVQVSAPGGATAAQPAPPPGTWPTNQPYTDAAGNTWTWNAQQGWQISAPSGTSGSGGVLGNVGGWLMSNSVISAVPNWALVAGAVAAGIVLLKMGGRRR